MMFAVRKALPDLMLSGISSNLRLNWSSLAAQACERLEKAVNFLAVFDIPACSNDDPNGKIKALVHRSCEKIGQSYLKDINTPEIFFRCPFKPVFQLPVVLFQLVILAWYCSISSATAGNYYNRNTII